MLANLGFGALVLALLVALYGVAAVLIGVNRKSAAWIDSARQAMLLTFPLLSITVLSLLFLLANGHYEVRYVASVTSNSMPLYLRLTALWGGQAGSLLFWSWLMSAFASAAMLRKWERDREFLPWVILVALITLAFFLALGAVFENPFVRLWQVGGRLFYAMFQIPGGSIYQPPDGNGLNPLLRHPGMIIHPPMLYLGFVSFVIPYAYAIAALITGRTDDRWMRITRRWTLVAWLFLSLGLVLGARWAYDVLGWGGYWGWDPVEIAAFMPWLTGTAFLHSVMVQEKRGMFKQWNMALIILTYALVIFGTFLTRSGVLTSVHAFGTSAIGPLFLAFITLMFAGSLALLIYRWNSLRSEGEMTSVFSREALFLLNNLLFVGITLVCFWGVIFPLITEGLGIVGDIVPAWADVFSGQKITVGAQYYERATGPLFAGLLLLMGVAPLAAWRHSTAKTLGRAIWKPTLVSLLAPLLAWLGGMRHWAALLGFWLAALVVAVTLYDFWRTAWARHRMHDEALLLALWRLAGRNRRRYGGYIIHLGVVLMAIGIIGIEVFQTQTQGTLAQGESLALGDYSITYERLNIFDTPDGRNVARAAISVYREGEYLGELYPRRDYYYEWQQTVTMPGVRSTWENDFYVILVDWQPVSTLGATFKVYHNPLVNWLWLGGLVFILGTMVAAWPDQDPELQRAAQRKAAPAATQA